MKHIYRALLRLYPYDYRYAFASEMFEAFENAHAEQSARGAPAYVRFAAGELAALLTGALVEWIAKLVSNDSRQRALPDFRLMRPVRIHGSVWYARVKGSKHVSGL